MKTFKIHTPQQHYLYDQIKEDEVGKALGRHSIDRHTGFGIKPENVKPLGRPTCIYKDNIQIDVTEIRWKNTVGFMWRGAGTSDRLL
jgi:hypothetical protein